MRHLVLVSVMVWGVGCGPPDSSELALAAQMTAGEPAVATGQVRHMGAPHLDQLETQVLFGEVWERPQLSPRDRSLVTLAVTQALHRTEAYREYLTRALDAGVTPEEISEAATHVTMYAGWPSGSNASRVLVEVFRARSIPFPDPEQSVTLEIGLGGRSPGYPAFPYLSALTRSVLFDESLGLWFRPILSARDRSMITIAVTQALYATDHLGRDIGRGLDNGLTADEIAEIMTQVTLYAGWPSGSNASRLAAAVFGERGVAASP